MDVISKVIPTSVRIVFQAFNGATTRSTIIFYRSVQIERSLVNLRNFQLFFFGLCKIS